MNRTDDRSFLELIQIKLESRGGWGATRSDVRRTGLIASEHGFAKQRDDENYLDFVNRLLRLMGENNEHESTEEV